MKNHYYGKSQHPESSENKNLINYHVRKSGTEFACNIAIQSLLPVITG